MTLLVTLDILVALLLSATIGFCIVLNRRLSALRRNESELKQVLAQFNEAAERAETGVARLKEVGNETAATLRERIGEAKALRDDLAFVAERSDRIASDLGRKLTSTRPLRSEPPPRTRTAPPSQAMSAAERELLAALEQAR